MGEPITGRAAMRVRCEGEGEAKESPTTHGIISLDQIKEYLAISRMKGDKEQESLWSGLLFLVTNQMAVTTATTDETKVLQ